MTTVTGTVLRPTGEPVVNAQVIIDLVASVDDEGAPGYVPADLTEVWAKTVVRTDVLGVWEADLPPTAGTDNVYSQNGVVYSVIYRISRREQGVHYIDVPASGAALWVGGLLVDAPSDIPSVSGAPSGASYLLATTAGLANEVVVGATPGGQLGGTWAAPTVDTLHAGGSHVASSISFTPAGTIAATNVQAALEEVAAEAGGGSSAPTTADYLVGTAQGGLSAEIVVGTTPGGELGGTWASPTVDATHSGSSHAGIQTAAEATAAAALSGHVAASDPHPVYLTAAEGNAAYDASGAAAARAPADVNYYVGTASASLSAEIPIGTTTTDGHVLRRAGGSLGWGAVDLADTDAVTGVLPDANISSTIARDSETTAAIAALSSVYQPLDATLTSVAAYNTNGILAQTAADTFAGRTITGTANKIAVTNGSGVSGDPTLTIDTGYLGQTSITTLGTIGTGVWNGTAIADANLALSYALLAGRSGGQSLIGGTASGEDLTLQSTSNATRGTIFAVDEIEQRPTDQTFTAATKWLFWDNTYTLNFASATPGAFISSLPTLTFQQAGAAAPNLIGINLSPTLANKSDTAVGFGGTVTIQCGAFLQADTQTGLTTTSHTDFYSVPTLTRVNSGTMTTTNVTGFQSTAVILTGHTVTTRTAFLVQNPLTTGTLTTQYGLDIPSLTGATTNIGIRTAAPVAYTRVKVITATSDTIPHTSAMVRLNNTSGSSKTLASAPTISDGIDGERLIVWNASAQNVVLQDQGTLASSNLRLTATSVTLGSRDSIELMFHAADGDWYQIGNLVNVI